MSGVVFLIFRKFPIKCPHCNKIVSTKKDWKCPHCEQMQGQERYLMDKCRHCKQMIGTSFCDHCKKEFLL
jgi:methionyl-tRNA synthetase